MKLDTTDKVVDHVRDWSVDKIEEAELVGDKIALYAEFEEWIELDDVEEIEIVSLCDKGVSGSTTITPDDV
jgi:hypothetical protein